MVQWKGQNSKCWHGSRENVAMRDNKGNKRYAAPPCVNSLILWMNQNKARTQLAEGQDWVQS